VKLETTRLFAAMTMIRGGISALGLTGPAWSLPTQSAGAPIHWNSFRGKKGPTRMPGPRTRSQTMPRVRQLAGPALRC